jgi:hypothetical protein
MKTTLEHTATTISNAIKNNNTVFLNKGGVITECRGILYNDTIIKMVPLVSGESILLAPEDEVYFETT